MEKPESLVSALDYWVIARSARGSRNNPDQIDCVPFKILKTLHYIRECSSMRS